MSDVNTAPPRVASPGVKTLDDHATCVPLIASTMAPPQWAIAPAAAGGAMPPKIIQESTTPSSVPSSSYASSPAVTYVVTPAVASAITVQAEKVPASTTDTSSSASDMCSAPTVVAELPAAVTVVDLTTSIISSPSSSSPLRTVATPATQPSIKRDADTMLLTQGANEQDASKRAKCEDDKSDSDIGGSVAEAETETTVTAPMNRRKSVRWTKREDEMLKRVVSRYNDIGKQVGWKTISSEFYELSGSARTDVQCLHRWNKSLKPGLVKGPWTAEEDQVIRVAIMGSGYEGGGIVRWSCIAKLLNGRLGKQVRERWINHLDPNISKLDWTSEEDERLHTLREEHGNRWKLLAKMLPGRSENGVKNRWHSLKPNLEEHKHMWEENARKISEQALSRGKGAGVGGTNEGAAMQPPLQMCTVQDAGCISATNTQVNNFTPTAFSASPVPPFISSPPIVQAGTSASGLPVYMMLDSHKTTSTEMPAATTKTRNGTSPGLGSSLKTRDSAAGFAQSVHSSPDLKFVQQQLMLQKQQLQKQMQQKQLQQQLQKHHQQQQQRQHYMMMYQLQQQQQQQQQQLHYQQQQHMYQPTNSVDLEWHQYQQHQQRARMMSMMQYQQQQQHHHAQLNPLGLENYPMGWGGGAHTIPSSLPFSSQPMHMPAILPGAMSTDMPLLHQPMAGAGAGPILPSLAGHNAPHPSTTASPSKFALGDAGLLSGAGRSLEQSYPFLNQPPGPPLLDNNRSSLSHTNLLASMGIGSGMGGTTGGVGSATAKAPSTTQQLLSLTSGLSQANNRSSIVVPMPQGPDSKAKSTSSAQTPPLSATFSLDQ